MSETRPAAWTAFKANDLAAFNTLLTHKGQKALTISADAEMKADIFKPGESEDDTH